MYGYKLGLKSSGVSTPIAPVNTVAPVISGTAVVGQTLSSTTGTWTGTPTPTYSYQWKRGATNIGTNSSSYTLVQADAGNTSNITCVVTATNAGGSANATSNTIAQILTVRTSAFLTASAITDATIRGGLNTFDIGLIANSLDTKMKAVYPFVGGTASTHKFNFMNSADTDAAFRILFNGSVTHTSNGVQGNAINGFLDTRLNTSTNLTKTSAHLSLYIRNNPVVPLGRYDMGNASNAGLTTDPTYLIARYNTGIAAFGLADSSYATSAASTNSIGFWNGATNGSSAQVLYRNGTSYATGTAGAGAFANNNLYIAGANANGTLAFPTDREYAFSSIGDGLSSAQASTFYTLVQGLQTTLGRQV